MRSRPAMVAFALLCTFALCANLETAIHEFGHALGCWIGGGRVTGFVLRPFDFSYVPTAMGTRPPWSHMLMSGGGILFGILFALPLLPLARRARPGSLGWLIPFATGTFALGKNGVLLLQSAATGHGDPEAVLVYADAGYHIPPAVMRVLFVLLSVPILVGFARLLLRLLRAFGPAPDQSRLSWLLTVEAGVMPYFLLMTAHSYFWGDREMLLKQMLPFYVPFMLLFALLVGGVALWTWRTRAANQADSALPESLVLNAMSVLILFVLAVAVIGGELAFLGPP
ncbi:MAG: M50 family metallopeptidase [Planctomycetota bacterium]|nr:M50 family metallopeptidase [Planctomycetota bacterium]